MSNKFGKIVKTTLTVIGAAAIAKVVSDKLSKMHNKKLCDCINKKFNNDKNIVIKSFKEEECLECCDEKNQEDNMDTIESNVFRKYKNHIMMPNIMKYEFPKNRNHFSKNSIKINKSSASCFHE